MIGWYVDDLFTETNCGYIIIENKLHSCFECFCKLFETTNGGCTGCILRSISCEIIVR